MEPVDVRDLVGRPGLSRPVRVAEPVEGLSAPLAEVPSRAPVAVDVLLESVVEGVLVSGRVAGRVTMRCARCLREFEREIEVGVQELFAPAAAPEDDEYPIREGFLDLEPMVRDAVVLQLPFSPLCREDCLGLCERCGGDRNAGECTCEPEVDPRWSGLESLMERFEGSSGGGRQGP